MPWTRLKSVKNSYQYNGHTTDQIEYRSTEDNPVVNCVLINQLTDGGFCITLQSNPSRYDELVQSFISLGHEEPTNQERIAFQLSQKTSSSQDSLLREFLARTLVCVPEFILIFSGIVNSIRQHILIAHDGVSERFNEWRDFSEKDPGTIAASVKRKPKDFDNDGKKMDSTYN